MTSHTIHKNGALSLLAILIACMTTPLTASKESKINDTGFKEFVQECMDKNPELSCAVIASGAASGTMATGLTLTSKATGASIVGTGGLLSLLVVSGGILGTAFGSMGVYLYAYDTCIARRNKYRGYN